MGAGRMGTWLVEELAWEHEVAVFDTDPQKLKFLFKAGRMEHLSEVKKFDPELVINAVSLPHTRKAFEAVLPYLPESSILSDIASVKTGLKEFYQTIGRRFVSSHPMFGPTFTNIRDLGDENAILIQESDEEGKEFFRSFYRGLKLNLYEYTFEVHDQTIAYSLSVPFVSSMVFAACMRPQEAPGATFKKHLAIARGLFSEDRTLLSEILFNPYTLRQVEEINSRLAYLTHILRGKDHEEIEKFFNRLEQNIG
jgi:prephenate dehydrogenase